MDRVKKDPYSCLLICRVFSNSNLAIAPVAISRFLENICQNAGLKEWEIKFKQNREILPWISRVVELVDWVPASTVYLNSVP